MPLGLPGVATLTHDLAKFAREAGAPIHAALRKKMPRLRFSFEKFAGDQGEAFVERLFTEAEALAPPLRSAVEKLKADPRMKPVGEVIEKLCVMAENNALSSSQRRGLARVVGDEDDVEVDDVVIDPRGLNLTEKPRNAFRRAFQDALMHGPEFTHEEREVMQLFIASVSNIEELLSMYFTLFMAGRSIDRKTYLYISWMLWAYLRTLTFGRSTLTTRSLYDELPTLTPDIITFNYTNFFKTGSRGVCFFHGRLDRYLRLDDRQIVDDSPALSAAINVGSIVEFINSLRLDVGSETDIDVPAIVPPISFKPVMSREQLRDWVRADDLLQRADVIVIVGYSFATADEHFNDLLRRCNGAARIIAVNPDLERTVASASRILMVDPARLDASDRAGHETACSRRLSCVRAVGEEVNASLIEAVLR